MSKLLARLKERTAAQDHGQSLDMAVAWLPFPCLATNYGSLFSTSNPNEPSKLPERQDRPCLSLGLAVFLRKLVIVP